ncbi:MAG: dCTP deaminase [Chitinophagales bacterium]|nr:dCTP deaminase [Chitinophagales bacterium]
MILTKSEIAKNIDNGKIKITPFCPRQLSTNSYDLRLGETIIRYKEEIINPKEEPDFNKILLKEEGLQLDAGEFILGHSDEKVGSDHFVPILHGKSNTARLGLFVHVTADLIDIGYFGNFTFQLYATTPIRIFPNMLIAQVSFWVPLGDIELYQGKYQYSNGPQTSKIYKDF